MKRINELPFNSLPDGLHLTPIVQGVPRALTLLNEIMDMCQSKFLNQEEMDTLYSRIDHLAAHMQQSLPHVTVKFKGHMFFRHAKKYIEEWGNLTYFIEQGIESLHAAYHNKANTFKVEKIRKQHLLLRWNITQGLLEASEPPPPSAIDYEFQVYEEADDE
ncbi:hypothetical protein Ddc_17741 [Ditylenchus destructor]|nr:hypothetical protein Ddc_17741 [Ditylenchus destructor]